MTKTSYICEDDVKKLAKSIKLKLSKKDIEKVLDVYDDYLPNYPEDNWTFIVEEIIYGEELGDKNEQAKI